MARKVIWTQLAWDDLEDAADYIARDSPHYAAAFVREAREAARSLTTLAERGRIVSEFNDPAIHQLFVRSHRLIYQVKDTAVYIIGFIHGSRDLQGLLE